MKGCGSDVLSHAQVGTFLVRIEIDGLTGLDLGSIPCVNFGLVLRRRAARYGVPKVLVLCACLF